METLILQINSRLHQYVMGSENPVKLIETALQQHQVQANFIFKDINDICVKLGYRKEELLNKCATNRLVIKRALVYIELAKIGYSHEQIGKAFGYSKGAVLHCIKTYKR